MIELEDDSELEIDYEEIQNAMDVDSPPASQFIKPPAPVKSQSREQQMFAQRNKQPPKTYSDFFNKNSDKIL